MNLKLTGGVKGEQAWMPVFKATLLELPLSSTMMISSEITLSSLTASQAVLIQRNDCQLMTNDMATLITTDIQY